MVADMTPAESRADRWAAAERRYDGPIPAHLRETIRLGGTKAWQLRYASAQSALFDRLARLTTKARAALLRRHRSGRDLTSQGLHRLGEELAAFRRDGLRWRDHMLKLRKR
jgi:hypothetical protein